MKHWLTPKRILLGVVFIVLGIVLYLYLPVFMPLILAFLTALVLEPLVRLVQKYLHLKKRLPAVTLVFLLFVCLIGALIYLTITKLVNEAIKFFERFPYYIAELTFFFEDLLERFNKAVADLPPGLIMELEKQLDRLLQKGNELAEQAIPLLVGWVQGIPNLVIVILIYLIALFLISLDLPKYMQSFYARFKAENATKVRYMFQRATRFFTGFFKAQFLVSVIIFIVSYIGLLLIAPRNALLMAVIIWLIDLIPIIGSIIILAPWATFELIAGNTSIGIQLWILAVILLVIRRTVEPKVMGDQIGLPPLPTLIGLYLGLSFLGVIGLIVGPLVIIAIISAKEAGIIKLDFKI